jgi:hypothetical protein|tara:strand:- start:1502 stop:1663 length:162 start_codon:yes stop_codon:yes gene_type:complete
MVMKKRMQIMIRKKMKRRIKRKIMMKMKKSLTPSAKLMGFLKREKVLMERNLN